MPGDVLDASAGKRAGTSGRAHDQSHFRRTLGNFPTGVAVITATCADGSPAGMSVGSFISVSLAPPLVAFCPARTSTSWPLIHAAGSFCVNLLTAEQEQLCRAFASKAEDKFAGLSWRPAPASGSPLFEDVAGWIDCKIDQVTGAGDHLIVVGAVLDLDRGASELPLIFYRGGYGRFTPGPLASADADLLNKLPIVDLARAEMDAVAIELGIPCMASVRSGDELVLAASAGGDSRSHVPTWIGTRFPFVAPINNVFMAWESEDSQAGMLAALRPDEREAQRQALGRVRERGYSMVVGGEGMSAVESTVDRLADAGRRDDPEGLLRDGVPLMATDFEPERISADRPVRALGAPVFGPDGKVAMLLNAYPLPAGLDRQQVERYAERLAAAGRTVSSSVIALLGSNGD